MNLNELDPESSPAAGFGVFLRTLREQHGWTQEHLARLIGCTASHVSALENGRRRATQRISTALDKAFGTAEDGVFRQRASEVKYSALLAGFSQYVEHEPKAVELRLFTLGIVPGLLQTTEYAAAIAAGAVERGSITPDQADERVRVLISRQVNVQRTPPPLVHAVLDESCVRRPVGGNAVMAAQLDRLVEFANEPNNMLQLAPYRLGERRAFDLPVYILTMRDRSLMSYAESAQQGHLERETDAVLPMLTAYYQLQGQALSQADSVEMIRELRRELS
ncbi:DNA-binding transcriptional regulator, XRE-family HTH domain [Streptomyces sp. TLI_053]|uniref:helix-turn-helix domain-containing protein n=1 Tax=Streptomyces sp. TLI_053 TaxID=1855352 RepID=UPI00087CFC3C|nr:helix-turn-helix transcriptional regulator [Streptomyces sp. TLI_053]SDT11539.1 DNA-binding transcriptional regulator, XRE-family HTH domain [Streptomyces sp. TLI_053]